MTVSMHIDQADPHLHGWCLAPSGQVAVEVAGTRIGRSALTPTRPDVVAAFACPSEQVGFDLTGGACLLSLAAAAPGLPVFFADGLSGARLLTLDGTTGIVATPSNHFRTASSKGCAEMRWTSLEWLGDSAVLKGHCANPDIASAVVYEVTPASLVVRGRMERIGPQDAGAASAVTVTIDRPLGPLIFALLTADGFLAGLDWLFAGYLLSPDHADHVALAAGTKTSPLKAVQALSIAEHAAFMRLAERRTPVCLNLDAASAERVPPFLRPLIGNTAGVAHDVCDPLRGVLWHGLVETMASLPRPSRVQLRKVIRDDLTGTCHVIEPPVRFPPELERHARCSADAGGIDGDPAKPLVTLGAMTFTHHRITRLSGQPNAASKGAIQGTLLGGCPPPAHGWQLSVALPFRDDAQAACDLLLSLLAQKGRGRLEIILLDSQSAHDPGNTAAREALEELVSDLLSGEGAEPNVTVRLMSGPNPPNHSAHLNRIVSAATNETVLLAAGGIILPDETVIARLMPLTACAGVATVGCITLTGPAPSPAAVTGGTAGFSLPKRFDPASDPPLQPARLPAAAYPDAILTLGNGFDFCLVRRPLFLALGGADAERFPGRLNDVDFCLRATAAGYHHLTALRCHVVRPPAGRPAWGGDEDPPFAPAAPPDFRRMADQAFRFWTV